jgi:hypothetical protein
MILLRFLLCSLLFLGLKDLFAFTDSRLVSLSVCSVFGRMIVLWFGNGVFLLQQVMDGCLYAFHMVSFWRFASCFWNICRMMLEKKTYALIIIPQFMFCMLLLLWVLNEGDLRSGFGAWAVGEGLLLVSLQSSGISSHNADVAIHCVPISIGDVQSEPAFEKALLLLAESVCNNQLAGVIII